MNKNVEKYMNTSKINFENDVKNGWWGVTPKELAKDKSVIGKAWLDNHTDNPEYYDVLFGDIKNGDWTGKVVLDYGSGFGGNLEQLANLSDWDTLIGYEISKNSVNYSKEYLKELGVNNISINETNGWELNNTKSNSVDFVTSIVVLQHIALHQTKYKIFEECYRVMKDGAIFSFQMNVIDSRAVPYKCEDIGEVTLAIPNCRVNNPEEVVDDLKKIGFSDVTYQMGNNPALGLRNGWVYFKAIK